MKKEEVKKPIYKKWWFWLGAFLLFGFIVGQTSDNEEGSTEVEAQEEQKIEEDKKDEEAAKEKEDKKQAKKDKEQAKEDEKKKEQEEKEAKKKENEDAIKLGLELWEAEEDGTKDFLMEMHRDNGMVDVGPNNDDYSVMNVVVLDEFRLLTDEEKEYLVNEMGDSVRNMVGSTFGHLDNNNKSNVYVNFIYPSQETAASQKMNGSWKIK